MLFVLRTAVILRGRILPIPKDIMLNCLLVIGLLQMASYGRVVTFPSTWLSRVRLRRTTVL